MSRLEDYIQTRDELEESIFFKQSTPSTIEKTKANKSASLYDLITMIGKIVKLTMPYVKFSPDEGSNVELDAMKDFNGPLITFKVKDRVSKKELKPRIRETIRENVDKSEDRVGEVWGQCFECLVQFNIIATDYEMAEKTMTDFEELMFAYTGYFKKNGVAEIIFKNQLTDDYYAKLRETLSVRNLIYHVEIEKLQVIFKERIEEIVESLSIEEE